MWLTHALTEWHDFYLLVGTASATLVALLFVAASLGSGFLTSERTAGTRTYMSPVVVHFAAAFFVSAIALAPGLPPIVFAVLIAAAAIVGLAISSWATVKLVGGMTQDRVDQAAYGGLPALAYLALLAAAGSIMAGIEWSLEIVAGAVLGLLLINIRNVWDLTLAMVRAHRGPDQPAS